MCNILKDSGKAQVVIRDETIWCVPQAMAQLFGVGVHTVSKHLKNIFEEGELIADSVVSKMEITTPHVAMDDESSSVIADAGKACGLLRPHG